MLHKPIHNIDIGIWNVMYLSPNFHWLSNYQRNWLQTIVTPIELRGPGTLIEEGKLFDKIFIIFDGKVIVEKENRKIGELERGDFVGAIEKIQRGKPADYTFKYSDPIELLSISKKDILDLIDEVYHSSTTSVILSIRYLP